MALKLILIRHCKSSWQDLDQDDHSRVLNPRGRADAPKIGAWLQDNGHIPQSVLCSDASRAQETWRGVSQTWQTQPPVTLVPTLYLAPDIIMFGHLQYAKTQSVAMVGHNPGIAEFAQSLVETMPKNSRFADYPTGATTIISFEISNWADLTENSGKVVDFITPGDLA